MKNHLLLGGLIGVLIFLPAPSARAEITHVTADTHVNFNRPAQTNAPANGWLLVMSTAEG